MAVEGLSHMTLIVRELDRMEQILETVLDARKVYDSGNGSHSLSPERFYLVGEPAPVWVAVMQGDAALPRSYNHIAFKIGEDEYERRYQSVMRLGLDVRPPRPRIDGEARSIYFHDDDNHLFELHTGTLEQRLSAYLAKTST